MKEYLVSCTRTYLLPPIAQANKANKKLVESNKQFLSIHAQVLAGVWVCFY
jgi:hypothetical protein